MVTIPHGTEVVIGIDVGGPTRGFHAVALKAGSYLAKLCTPHMRQLVSWCHDSGARVIAIDAPCRWSATARARRAERELMAQGIWCFSTPSFEIAKNHPSNYYGWMLHGAALYADLTSSDYSLFDGTRSPARPVCFETFPHAIACTLQGEVVSAKRKRQVRRTLLQEREINTEPLTNIDWIDAALCALTAHHFLSGSVNTYGDVEEGFIVVPR
jgi:predicted nuclease with RNAse H fold